MAKRDLPQKYFMRMLDQLLAEHPLCIDLYNKLVTIASHNGQQREQLKWLQNATVEEKTSIEFFVQYEL